MKKNILLISFHFPPYEGIASQRTKRIAKYIKKFGWDPFILTVDSKYHDIHHKKTGDKHIVTTPMVQIRKLYLKLKRIKSGENPVEENKVVLSEESYNSLLKKVKRWGGDFLSLPDHQIGWLPFAISAGIFSVYRKKIEYMFSTGPPWTSHLVALFIKKITKIKWVADFRDPWVANPWKRSLPESLEKYMQVLEKMVIRNADFIMCNTRELRDDFIKRYPSLKDKTGVVSNGFDPDDFTAFNPQNCPSNKKLVITHAGTLYGKRDPKYLLEALGELFAEEKIDKKRIQIIFLGDMEDNYQKEIKSIVDQYNLGDIVQIRGKVPKREALEMTALSDILLVIQPETRFQIPGKIYEYLAVRKPVLALVDDGPTADLVRKTESGVVVAYDNVKEIKDTIIYIQTLFAEKRMPTEFNFLYSEEHSEPHLTNQLSLILEKL